MCTSHRQVQSKQDEALRQQRYLEEAAQADQAHLHALETVRKAHTLLVQGVALTVK